MHVALVRAIKLSVLVVRRDRVGLLKGQVMARSQKSVGWLLLLSVVIPREGVHKLLGFFFLRDKLKGNERGTIHGTIHGILGAFCHPIIRTFYSFMMLHGLLISFILVGLVFLLVSLVF